MYTKKQYLFMTNPVYKTPEELKLLTDKSRSETNAFVKKLKKRKPRQLDTLVHSLHDEAFEKFSCLDCANCCKSLGPRLTDSDVARLARQLKIKPSDFTTQYLKTDEDGDLVFNQHPCPFLLADNYCMVYESRPKACREYPHTDRKKFYQILDLSHKNCETCPVVMGIMNRLKTCDL